MTSISFAEISNLYAHRVPEAPNTVKTPPTPLQTVNTTDNPL